MQSFTTARTASRVLQNGSNLP